MCVQPIYLKSKEIKTARNHFTTPVPCGNCPECARAKCNAWLFRIQQEMRITTTPLFITLTYDEKTVPKTTEGKRTLLKKDIQDWIKRLRFHYAKYSDKQIRYFAVGEYGTKRTKRPHYHIIMLNMDIPDFIRQTWTHGNTKTLPVLDGGIPYVLKYLHKRKVKRLDGTQAEFSLMSKKLGANFLTEKRIRFHNQAPEFAYLRLENGVKMSLPKYYKEKIYDASMRAEVTHYLQKRADNAQDEMVNKLWLNDLSVPKEIIRKNLENSKLHSKFDKRIETL